MNIWDSVHRGLEKASQEAGRIAKIRRLRATIDNVNREMNGQSTDLINKAMDLFGSGQLTQMELLSFCQELTTLRQQLTEAQNELQQIQASQPAPGTTQQFDPATGYQVPAPSDPTGYTIASTSAASGNDYPATQYAPPPPGFVPPPATSSGSDYLPTQYAPPPPNYVYPTNETQSAQPPPPPPPPGDPLTVSSMSTLSMDLAANPQTCASCQAVLNPNHAFCHNCGTPVQKEASDYLPTTYAPQPQTSQPLEQGTQRATPSPEPPTPQAPALTVTEGNPQVENQHEGA